VKYEETIFDILARQFEIAKLDEAKEGALIQVVDAAIPPDRRSFPKRSWIVAGAAALGLLFGVFAALIASGLESARRSHEFEAKLTRLQQNLAFRPKSNGMSR
jgi:tyrosine-protein kinase Etk/Wzc